MKIIVSVKAFLSHSTMADFECKSMNHAQKKLERVNKTLDHNMYYADIEIPTELNK